MQGYISPQNYKFKVRKECVGKGREEYRTQQLAHHPFQRLHCGLSYNVLVRVSSGIQYRMVLWQRAGLGAVLSVSFFSRGGDLQEKETIPE